MIMSMVLIFLKGKRKKYSFVFKVNVIGHIVVRTIMDMYTLLVDPWASCSAMLHVMIRYVFIYRQRL